jgi:hypothetical protein
MRIFLIFVGPMSLSTLFADLAAYMQTDQFRQLVCDPEHPTAFQRRRKLPLPALIALMLTGMRKSVQTELDEFFAHLQHRAQLLRKVSGQAFALARAKLSTTAIPALNDWLIEQAGRHRYVPRWNSLTLVAADASTVRFGLCASHVKRAALPKNERQMPSVPGWMSVFRNDDGSISAIRMGECLPTMKFLDQDMSVNRQPALKLRSLLVARTCAGAGSFQWRSRRSPAPSKSRRSGTGALKRRNCVRTSCWSWLGMLSGLCALHNLQHLCNSAATRKHDFRAFSSDRLKGLSAIMYCFF